MKTEKDFTHGGNVHKASVEMNMHRNKIIDFSANINPLGLSPKGRRAIIKGLDNIKDYPDPDYRVLKNALSDYYNVDEFNCLLGNGAIELIYFYVRLKKPGRALIPAPGFVEYEKALVVNGWEVSLYNSKDDINLQNIDVVFICNPNNPTGVSYSESFLKELLNKAKISGSDIFLDEAFIDYSTYDSMVKHLGEYDNLYILKSLTKFFAIPGLRLGCLLTSNQVFKNGYTRNQIPWSINSIAEEYIVASLKDKKYITLSKEYIKRERVWLYQELSKIGGLNVFRTQGNYLMFKIEADIDLYLELKKQGVLVRSCSNYNGLDSSYYRVAVKKRKFNKKLLLEIKRIFGNY